MTMDDFSYSQSSMQDYLDCQMRFRLRYQDHLNWPAAEVDGLHEMESRVRRGIVLHHMIHQYLLGIPAEAVVRTAARDSLLPQWWTHFLDTVGAQLPQDRYPEIPLAGMVGPYRLVAQYDLITVNGDCLEVYDWKAAVKRPKRRWLEKRMQTRVYPYLLAQQAASLFPGRTFSPDQIRMTYWFAGEGEDTETFQYSQDQFGADQLWISSLMQEIARKQVDAFYPAKDARSCHYCAYRSYCNRPAEADDPASAEESGDVLDADALADALQKFSFDGIEMISF